MNVYRVTIRYGPPHRYHVEDIRADSLRDAMGLAAVRFPEAITASSDLVEIRRQIEPEQRVQAPG